MTLFRNRIALAGLGICSFASLLAVVVSLNSVALVATAEARQSQDQRGGGPVGDPAGAAPTIKTVSIANSDIATWWWRGPVSSW